MRILLTNDDGIDAPGIKALHRSLDGLGHIEVVAPMEVQSATSHAVTFHRPISVRHRDGGYAVAGRPADCVKLGIAALFDEPFDLVISGMNSGANVGINVLYSGTVGAAREATFNNIPAIAVSLHIGSRDKIAWDRAAAHARRAIDRVLTGPMDGKTVLNINVPVLDDGAEPRGIKVVPASLSGMVVQYLRGVDEAGDTTYRVSDTMSFAQREDNTDVHALFDRFITVTPLHFDTTCPVTTPAWVDAMKS